MNLVDKTIKSIDGTSVLLETENVLPSIGLIGIMPYFNQYQNKRSES